MAIDNNNNKAGQNPMAIDNNNNKAGLFKLRGLEGVSHTSWIFMTKHFIGIT